MNAIVDGMWARLRVMFSEFSREVALVDPTLRCEIRRTANEAFARRGYLSFMRRKDGDEVAIIVDVKHEGHRLVVQSDACAEGGAVIAEGPSATVALSATDGNADAAFDRWLNDFGRFLLANEQVVTDAVRRLS